MTVISKHVQKRYALVVLTSCLVVIGLVHVVTAAAWVRGDVFRLHTAWSKGVLFFGGFEGVPKWTNTIKVIWNTTSKYTAVTPDPKNAKNKVLETTYLKGSYSSNASSVGASATIFKVNFGRSGINIGNSDKLYLRYDVMFPKGFQFGKSGKLPGLAGGNDSSGGTPPTGYDGWSGRLVWEQNGGLASYLYIPGIEKYGLELPWSYHGRSQLLTTDKWHCLVVLYQLNTPGASNGLMRGWIDNRLAFDQTGLVYRKTSSLSIDNLLFSSFFGGSTPDYASPATQHAYFDNFIVSKEKIGCEKP